MLLGYGLQTKIGGRDVMRDAIVLIETLFVVECGVGAILVISHILGALVNRFLQ